MLDEMTLCEELFHTPSGVAFADFITDGHRETWPIRSKRFRNWVRRCYYQATGAAAGAAVIGSALNLLEARAQFDAPERAVNIRVAEHAGRLYLDLADEHWRAVAIGPDGWRVLGCPPVRFRRSPGMLPLPVPERGGSIEALRSFLNLSNQNDFVLVVAWLLAALRSGGPYPLLAISGEQGSAKTVLSKLLRALVDPNVAPVRALPREERELMIAANNGHLLAFDNLSGLSSWLSDALCRLASGGSFAVRQLYTDDEEVLFQAARPILLNGIEDVISRPDLGDRAIFLTLGANWRGATASRGRTLARVRNCTPTHPGRPARRGGAWPARPGWRSARPSAAHGRFRPLGQRLRNRAVACRHFRSRLRGKPQSRHREHHRSGSRSHLRACNHGRPDQWTGSASDLLRLCAESARDETSIGPAWAKNPRALAGRLRRAQTFLRTLGIEITFSREGRAGTKNDQGEHDCGRIASVPSASSVLPRRNGSGGAPAVLSAENRQSGLQTMLTVLTQTQLQSRRR